jgi:hypothetical protein
LFREKGRLRILEMTSSDTRVLKKAIFQEESCVEKRSLTNRLGLGGLVKLRKIERGASLIQASNQKDTSPLPIIHFEASANFLMSFKRLDQDQEALGVLQALKT